MALADFPKNPANGDTHTTPNGTQYTWNGVTWVGRATGFSTDTVGSVAIVDGSVSSRDLNITGAPGGGNTGDEDDFLVSDGAGGFKYISYSVQQEGTVGDPDAVTLAEMGDHTFLYLYE